MTQEADSIAAFRDLANAFCRWCEGPSLGLNREATLSIWFARLHAAALQLPEVGPEFSEDFPDIPDTGHAAAQRNIAPFMGAYYRSLFDPDCMKTDAPGMGDLGDDLLDIYTDLKRGCLLDAQGRLDEALWFWSHMHRLHWGKHAVDAMVALHSRWHLRQ